jgi:protein tyrosine/serine phosphatase
VRPHRHLFNLACAIVLLAVPSLALSAASASSTSIGAAGNLPAIAIDNFGRINEQYYRGAQPRGRDYADLARLGVKTIVDLTAAPEASADEPAAVAAAGMKFVRIPLTTHDQPSDAAVARFLAVVNDPANQPVFVHCQGGRHRTGALTAVYRMTHDGWSAERAYAEMEHYRFGPAFLHSALRNFVYAYPATAKLARSSAAPAATKTAGSSQP